MLFKDIVQFELQNLYRDRDGCIESILLNSTELQKWTEWNGGLWQRRIEKRIRADRRQLKGIEKRIIQLQSKKLI